MEIGIEPGMNCYAGGLGVLAGDFARAAADLGLPIVFVTLVSRQGYIQQSVDDEGRQIDTPDPWNPADWATPLKPIVNVQIEDREVAVRAWLHRLEGAGGSSVGVLLLDTDLPQNSDEDRALTDRLYGGDAHYRLRQEALLGIGTPRMMAALELKIARWHLNEGHAALLPLELLVSGVSRQEVVEATVFTTHTPLAAGRDRFDLASAKAVLADEQFRALMELTPEGDALDLTLLALRVSGYANAVSRRHQETASRLYPGQAIASVTNGVHAGHWAAPAMQVLFDAEAPGWRTDSARLAAISSVDPAHIANGHSIARANLIEAVAIRSGLKLDPGRPIICFSRRMTGYKRPTLVFDDPARLNSIARRFPFTLLFAGKAHPNDGEGKSAIAQIGNLEKILCGEAAAVFIPGYGLDLARILVAGADLWLNLPVPPLEASGTSGMKAAVNGVLNLSTPDGWWLEAFRENLNGWTIGRDGGNPAEHGKILLDLLEHEVLPTWYEDRARWQRMMRDAVATIAPAFSADRAMREYAGTAYRLWAL